MLILRVTTKSLMIVLILMMTLWTMMASMTRKLTRTVRMMFSHLPGPTIQVEVVCTAQMSQSQLGEATQRARRTTFFVQRSRLV
ncbi:hypothetical protein BYT27DRAFT_6651174 [Phlegmacium glaucopus]|nr:hypothetical protein BYT27DRAFT_6651174 [Phlegmacium glaucopus]